MLGLLEAVVESKTAEWPRVMWAVLHVKSITRALSETGRQRWVSLLVRLLKLETDFRRQKVVIVALEVLWRSDGAPWKTYGQHQLELQRMRDSARGELDHALMLLLCA